MIISSGKARVAQWIEQSRPKGEVEGSTPSAGTKNPPEMYRRDFLFVIFPIRISWFYLILFLKFLDGLKRGIFEAEILMGSPVRGLTPALARLLPTSNVPKPVKVIFPPWVISLAIKSSIVCTPTSASRRERPVDLATSLISSLLFILILSCPPHSR